MQRVFRKIQVLANHVRMGYNGPGIDMYLEKEAVNYFRNYDIREFLFRLEKLPRSGNIPSRKTGRNMEFEKFSRYEPGDGIQDIDWKVYARSGKLFIKNYGLDTRTKVRIVLDHSQSMNYPDSGRGSGQSKLNIAKKTAAILSYLLVKKHNTVSLAVLGDQYRDIGVARPTTINKMLSGVHPQGRTLLKNLPKAEKTATFLISDGWWGDCSPAQGAAYLEKQAIHFFHVLSPDEIHLSLKGDLILRDMEKKTQMPVIPSRIRDDYVREMANLIREYEKRLGRSGLLYRPGILDKKYYLNLRLFLDQPVRRTAPNRIPAVP